MEQGRRTDSRYRLIKKAVIRGVSAGLLCIGLAGGAAADMGTSYPGYTGSFDDQRVSVTALAAEFGSLPVGNRQLADIRGGFSIGGIDVKIGFVLKTILNDVVQVEQTFNLENVGDSIPDSVVNDFSENGKVSMTSTEFFKDGSLLVTKVVNQKDNVDLKQINTAIIDVVLPGSLVSSVNSGIFRGATKDMSNAFKFALYQAGGL